MIKTIKICGKTSDLCNVQFIDETGKRVGESDSYVPNFMPGEHDGDYIILDIDINTGKILNWKKPTQKQLSEAMK